MSGETCPHCGAKVIAATGFGTLFFCDSSLDSRGHIDQQSRRCLQAQRDNLETQLATVTAERDAKAQVAETWALRAATIEQRLTDLQQRIDAAPVAWVTFNESGEVGTIAHGDIVATAGNSRVERCSIIRSDDQPGD